MRRPALRSAVLLLCCVALAAPLSAQRPTAQLRDLPLVEVPPTGDGAGTLAILLTGDGDWAAYVKGVAQGLAAEGVAVVGLKSRSYLGRPRTPDELARDVERIARHYMATWRSEDLLLVGYSRGADFAPFVAARLPADLRARISLLALLSPAPFASFEFHLTDLVRDTRRPSDLPTLPEFERIGKLPLLCMYGSDEPDSLCTALPPGSARVVSRAGGHRASDHRSTTALIVDALRAGP